jgi:bleomycin hydrolase
MIKFTFALFVLFGMTASVYSQEEVIYRERMNGFYQESIIPAISAFQIFGAKTEREKILSCDFTGLDFPGDVSDFNSQWHNKPLSQGATGTCWCFATISFLESEIHRQTGLQVKLSEMYIVYWEYVARARYYVEHRGDMYFGQGSESNAVIRVMKEHGLVPAGQYAGMQEGQRVHDHGGLEKEIGGYFHFIKENNLWDGEDVVSNVRCILDHYLGTPPDEVIVEGNKISPLAYMRDIAGLNPDDYFSFMSTKSMNYNQKGELVEPDNWWHSDDYYNIPLTDFSGLFLTALEKGYTLSICGDVSEPGYDPRAEVGIIPSFDIPKEYINEDAREFRLYNGSTTDDHCIHVIGYKIHNGDLWYLIKDSGAGGFDGPNKGYRFIREDYVKLKMIALLTHKYAARDILDTIIK